MTRPTAAETLADVHICHCITDDTFGLSSDGDGFWTNEAGLRNLHAKLTEILADVDLFKQSQKDDDK